MRSNKEREKERRKEGKEKGREEASKHRAVLSNDWSNTRRDVGWKRKILMVLRMLVRCGCGCVSLPLLFPSRTSMQDAKLSESCLLGEFCFILVSVLSSSLLPHLSASSNSPCALPVPTFQSLLCLESFTTQPSATPQHSV